MKISPLHLVTLASLMLSCEDSKPAPVAVRPAGMDLPELVFASNAPPFQPLDQRFIEVLVTADEWDIQHMGKHVGFATEENGLFGLLKKLRELDAVEGFQSRVLISAAGNTKMLEINKLVRTTATSDIGEIYFLTKSSKHQLEASAFSLQMPIHGCGQRPDIEPLFIQIQNDGRVYVGSGASRQLLDQDLHDNALPGLNGVLDIYAAAGRAANAIPLCQFYYSEEATYQRFIPKTEVV